MLLEAWTSLNNVNSSWWFASGNRFWPLLKLVKNPNHSCSVWPCLRRMKRQEQLPYVPSTQIFSAKSGKINLFAFRHFLFPFMGSRQNLPQWGMKTTCSPLSMSSWNQPLDSSFCQVISSHHESRWYNFFPLTFFPQLWKKGAQSNVLLF